MTGSIDNQKTRDFVLEAVILIHNGSLLSNGFDREVSGTDLLCDATSFALLDVSLTDLVE